MQSQAQDENVRRLTERLFPPKFKPVAVAHRRLTMVKFSHDTPDEVCDTLRRLCEVRAPIRLFYGDTETGQSWHDEHDVCGLIGLSSINPAILLLVPTRSHGGTPILDRCIVAIRTKHFAFGGWAYRHPTFRVGDVIYEPCETPEMPELRWQAKIDGIVHARFKTRVAALRYKRFITGENFNR